MGEAEGAEGAGASAAADVATMGGVGDAAEAAAAAALGSELNAYDSGYADASIFNASDDRAQIQPGMEEFYAEGYGEGVADAIAAMDQNAVIEQQGMNTVSVTTAEE